jgi:predicted transcriptional regulator with HTH domain
VSETRTPEADDARTEAAVLRQLLALYPVQLSLAELVREVSDDPEDFAASDAVQRAVRELIAAGLVHRLGEVVLPSRAALRFDELLG